MERGSAVGIAGVKLETAEARIAEETRFTFHTQGAGKKPSEAKEESLAGYAGSEAFNALLSSARAGDGDERSVKGTGRFGLGQMPEHTLEHHGVLISSYARTQSTIATRSAESEYYGACACASEAQLVADKTIKLVKVKGTQHPTDVGTKYLSKQRMIHAKSPKTILGP
eukprot:4579392-Amphidinium_carterae.3